MSRLFEDEDNTADLFNEKTHHEEATAHEDDQIPSFYQEEDRTPSEDTAIVDPQELDFQSVFDDIELEEVSEVTKSIAWISKPPDPAELEPTGGLPESTPKTFPGMAVPSRPAMPTRTKGLLIFGGIFLCLGVFWVLTHRPLRSDKALNVELEEVRGGGIQVDSDPQGAAIYLDGQMTGKTTPAFLEIKKLSFPLVLGVSQAGPPQWTQSVQQAPGELLKVYADLKAASGTLDLLSRPPGAEVFLGEQLLGQTPLLAQRVPAEKSLKISFQLPGYRPTEQRVYLKTGQNRQLEPVLQKSPSR
jgi:hypothetical protein